MSSTERALPADIESEHVVIGAIVKDPRLINSVRHELSPHELSAWTNQTIYSAMLALDEKDSELSPQLISAQTSGAVAMTTIVNMAFGVPVFANLKIYITRIKQAAQRRWAIEFARHLEEMAFEGSESNDEMFMFAANEIDHVRTTLPQTRQTARQLSEMLEDQALRYELWHRGISNALPTGFEAIDNHLLGGGLVKSGLYILAARPSLGKSSLALDIAANVASIQSVVHIVSREMPAESLFDRLHAAATGIARWKLRPGIYDREYQKLIKTLPAMAALPIVLDNASLTVSDIRRTYRELARKQRKPELVIVDYIQLLNSEGNRRSRNDEVGSITRALKGMAMEFDVPILALSQLSREPEKQNREPQLSDLRDSGEIEQDADAVFFLFGDKPEEGAKFFARTFKCSKQRDGELFREELTFTGELVTFRTVKQIAMNGIQEMGDVA